MGLSRQRSPETQKPQRVRAVDQLSRAMSPAGFHASGLADESRYRSLPTVALLLGSSRITSKRKKKLFFPYLNSDFGILKGLGSLGGRFWSRDSYVGHFLGMF